MIVNRICEQELYAQIFLYVVPVFVTSILLGVWGLNIVTRMLNPSFPDMNLRGKYLALQLVLMANKLQPIISTLIVANVDFHCTFPLTAALYRQGMSDGGGEESKSM